MPGGDVGERGAEASSTPTMAVGVVMSRTTSSRVRHSVEHGGGSWWSKTVWPVAIIVLSSIVLLEGSGRLFLRLRYGRWHPLEAPFFNRIPVLRKSEWLGWEYIPNAHGIERRPDRNIPWSINARGLRESEEYSYGRDGRSKIRILVLGDSFTAGHGVDESERWTERLSAQLGAEVEIINAGVPAYAADQEFMWYRTEGVRYQPDVVVFAHLEENLVRIGIPYFCYEPKYLKPSLRLDHGQLATVEPTRLLQSRIALGYWSLADYVIDRLLLGPVLGSPFAAPTQFADRFDKVPLLVEILARAQEVARAGQASLSVLYLPAPTKALYANRSELEGRVVAALRARGIPVFSAFHPYLDGVSDDELQRLRYDDDGHWRPAGQERFADIVLPYFRELVAR